MVKLMEMGGRPVTLLDGDIVRKNLSSELGFSKEHRDLNIRRIGYVASEITKNGGIAICAPIAPYATTRRAVREDIEQFGAFIEVHVATSIEECERRDRKGLYQRAREGKIKELCFNSSVGYLDFINSVKQDLFFRNSLFKKYDDFFEVLNRRNNINSL